MNVGGPPITSLSAARVNCRNAGLGSPPLIGGDTGTRPCHDLPGQLRGKQDFLIGIGSSLSWLQEVVACEGHGDRR